MDKQIEQLTTALESAATTEYYNAKPSKIGNIGKDVAGARRMNYDTYETDAEKKTRLHKKAVTKELNTLKDQLKENLFSAEPNSLLITRLLTEMFTLKFSFDPTDSGANEYMRNLRAAVDRTSRDSIKEYNKVLRAYNTFRCDIARLESFYADRFITKLKKKYSPKKSIIKQTGKTFNWKSFDQVTALSETTAYLADNTSAVQFGNSVSDNERAYIANELAAFIKLWKKDSIFSKVDISNVNWSFGARGKAGSVAYYQPKGKILSVNRNNIGSLIHELGHHIDFENGSPSRKISMETVRSYRDSIRESVRCPLMLRYYCDRREIFARAFEAYCYKVKAGFSEFAQYGNSYLPELNDELLNILSGVLRA